MEATYTRLVLSALDRNRPDSAETREALLARARLTLREQLESLSPKLDSAEIDAELKLLEHSIEEAVKRFPLLPPGRRIKLYWNKESMERAKERAKQQPDPLSPASLLFRFRSHDEQSRQEIPGLVLKALIVGTPDKEGLLVEEVRRPWYEILERFRRNPREMYEIDPFIWEEIIAGAYEKAGFDRVVLTPRSGDKGHDIDATKYGLGSIRFFDQVKAYGPDHVVTADEVRAVLGTITAAGNVSKGVISTTSKFAPKLLQDEFLKNAIPFRIELRDRDQLLPWLYELSERKG